MNILILSYQGHIAGSTFSVSYLANGLADKGYNVILGTRKGLLLWDLLKNSNVKRVDIPFKNKLDFKSVNIINQIIKEQKIDIINAQASRDRYISMIIKKFYHPEIKVVHTRRQIPDSSINRLSGKLYSWGADYIVAVSNGVKDSLLNMGISENKLKVINNGTPEDKFNDAINVDSTEIKKKYHIDDNDFVIGCISRHKQQEQLINALNLIKETKLKVIFAGFEKEKLEMKLVEKIPENHDIIFLGKIKPEEALKLYKIFDLHILPSITEGLSQSLLEAMYLGVPVIATDAGGNPDLIQNAENGYLFKENDLRDIADKIKTLLNNKQIYDKFKINGKKTVMDKFTISSVINNYEVFFESILKEG